MPKQAGTSSPCLLRLAHGHDRQRPDASVGGSFAANRQRCAGQHAVSAILPFKHGSFERN
eukprot:1989106-Prorocentrum_lima.AAC.1